MQPRLRPWAYALVKVNAAARTSLLRELCLGRQAMAGEAPHACVDDMSLHVPVLCNLAVAPAAPIICCVFTLLCAVFRLEGKATQQYPEKVQRSFVPVLAHVDIQASLDQHPPHHDGRVYSHNELPTG
eukprot:365554-Chlamydomonas_euryale.AAC.18